MRPQQRRHGSEKGEKRMKNVFQFFQKNSRDSSSGSHKGKGAGGKSPKQEKIALPEARFSPDERGQLIQSSWEEYLSKILNPTSPISVETSAERRQNFISFAKSFISSYQPIREYQHGESVNFDDSQEFVTIGDTWGHPSELIVHVANLLLNYVSIENQNSSSKNKKQVNDSSIVSLRYLFDGQIETVQSHRNHFLHILSCLELLSFWPHNRNILHEKLGLNYARVLVHIFRVLISKLEEIIVEYVELSSLIHEPKKSQSISPLDLETSFILQAHFSFVQIVERSSPGLNAALSNFMEGPLPSQPWSTNERRNFGYSNFCESKNPTYDSGLTNLEIPPQNSEKRREDTFSSCNENEILQLTADEGVDGWSTVMLQCGALRALLSLLHKLAYLSRTLATSRIYDPLPTAQNQDQEFGGYGFPVLWTSCVSLQCEALLGVLSFMNSHPLTSRGIFNICNGAGALTSLLSMQDAPPYDQISLDDLYLGFHRGLLCLRIVEQIVLGCSQESEVLAEASVRDVMLALDSLQLMMAWIQTYLVSQDKFCSMEKGLSSQQNISLRATFKPLLQLYPPSSEFWPWQSSERNSTPILDPGLSDLCEWDEPSIQYAGKDSMMKKILKSMKINENYSLRKAFIDVYYGQFYLDDFPLSWFAQGLGAELWDQLFLTLFQICRATVGVNNISESGKSKKSMKEDRIRRSNLFSEILSNLFVSLISCAEAQHCHISSSEQSKSKLCYLPVFQMHFVHFIGLCLEFFPNETINVCRKHKIWTLLASSSCFLLGGQEEISSVLLRGKRDVELDSSGKASVIKWNLHQGESLTDDPEIFRALGLRRSMSSLPKKPLSKSGTEENILSMDDDYGDDVSRFHSDESAEVHKKTLHSLPENEVSFFDVPEEESSSHHQTQIAMSPGSDSVLEQLGDSLNTTADLEESHTQDEVQEITHPILLRAFAWLSLCDSIFHLLSLSISAIDSVIPPTGASPELYAVLQAVGRETPDHVVVQTMNWIKSSLLTGGNHSDATNRSNLTDKCKHILFISLSLCKYQLLTSCDVTKSPPESENGSPPFWIGYEFVDINLVRPFLWSARTAAIDLIYTIFSTLPDKGWIKIFLPKTLSRTALGSSEGEAEVVETKDVAFTPKHVTLLLLILDPKCRDIALYLLMEILHVCTCFCHDLPFSAEDFKPMIDATTQHPSRKSSNSEKKQSPTPETNQSSKSAYHAVFHDILKCLFVSHVKYAMLQPPWCDGPGIVTGIYHWLKCFLGDSNRSSYLPYYQSMCLQYGQVTSFHYALNWAKPRPHIFRELFLSLDECIKRSGAPRDRDSPQLLPLWSAQVRTHVLKHFLALLSVMMKGSEVTKSKFASLMLLKKYSKNKAKVTTTTSSQHSSSNPYVTCNFHDVAWLISSLEEPSLEIFQILFEMLLDSPLDRHKSTDCEGLFYLEEDKLCFANLVVIPIILFLIPACSIPLQTQILFSIKNLLIGRFALINLSKCSDMQPPLLDSLFDLFLLLPNETRLLCAELMQIVGKHNISVAQLKRLFRMMHTQGDYRPTYTWMLISTLRNMISDASTPKHFFLFEGNPDSGLKIPLIHRWPAQNGHSFCFWFCVRNPSGLIKSSTDYRPTLLSIRQHSGIGFEVFLRPHPSRSKSYVLVFETHKELSEDLPPRSVEIESIEDGTKGQLIQCDKWYFLAFSHSPSKFRARSELCVLLNTSFSRHSLAYPKFLGEIEDPIIGNSAPHLLGSKISSALRGQIGSIYLFGEAFNESQLRQLYSVGMDLSTKLENAHMGKKSGTQTSDVSIGVNYETFSSAIILAYNPGVWDGNYFLDMTPEKNGVRWGKESAKVASTRLNLKSDLSKPSGKMHAFMLPGSHRCTFRDMRDALDCLGGKRVLIPLFAQFDLPSLGADGTENYSIDSKLCEEVILLFFSLIRDNDVSRQFMRQSGFQLISYFLERISPNYLTCELLEIFIDNSLKLSWNPQWYANVVKFILLDFKLWMFASYETQLRLFAHLIHLCQRDPQTMRDLVSIRELFDALYIIYPHDRDSSDKYQYFSAGESSQVDEAEIDLSTLSEDLLDVSEENFEGKRSHSSTFSTTYLRRKGSIYQTKVFVHEATGEVIAEKLTGHQLDEIRKLIFRMIFALMDCSYSSRRLSDDIEVSPLAEEQMIFPTEDEVQSILYYISHVTNPIAKVQAMQLLIRLLDTSSPQLHKKLIAGFCSGVKVYPLLALQVHANLQVRIYSFLVLCNVIQINMLYGILPSANDAKEDSPFQKNFTSPSKKLFSFISSPSSPGSLNFDERPDDVDEVRSQESLMERDDLTISMTRQIEETDYDSQHLSPPSKTSFSFIPPSTSNPKSNVRIENPNPHTSSIPSAALDTFSLMGIPVSTFRFVIMWAQDNLLTTSIFESSAKYSPRVIDQQCKLIVDMMMLTMIGMSSTVLASDIDQIFGDTDWLQSDHDTLTPTIFTEIQPVSPQKNLAEHIFCAAAFVPAIIRFISKDVVPYSLRFSTLVALKTKLQTFINCDLFLQVPYWQTSLFELLATEQQRIDLLQRNIASQSQQSQQEKNENSAATLIEMWTKELERGQAIIDTGTRMICDMFTHSVEYGCPTPAVIINRPRDESLSSTPKPSPVVVVQEISKGQRIFGTSILKETMAFFRCYAEKGELNVQTIALSLLQQIMNSLAMCKDSWKSSVGLKDEDLYDVIRMRTFNMCCWITISYIVEFFTFPVLQRNIRHSHRLRTQSEDVGDIPVSRRSLKETRHSHPNMASQIPATLSDSLERINPTLFARNVSFGVDSISEISDSDGASANSVLSQSLSQSPCLPHSTVPEEPMWTLLDSVIDLLENLDPNIHKSSGIKIALSIGLKASQDVLDRMNETIDDMAAMPSSSSAGVSDGDIEHTITGITIPARKIASQICWRLVRVLSNIFCQNGISRGGVLSPSYQFSQIQTIQRLRRMIRILEVRNWTNAKFELMNAAAKISEVLRGSVHDPTELWMQESLQLLYEIVEKVREEISMKFERAKNTPSSLSHEVSHSQSLSTVEDEKLSSNVGEMMNDLSSKHLTASDLTLMTINSALHFPVDLSISWNEWDNALSEVVHEALRMEDESLASTLTEFGIHRSTQYANTQLEILRKEEDLILTSLSKKSQKFSKKASDHETSSLQRLVKTSEALKKRNAARWNSILAELANERGPWGVGAEETVEAYWMIDPNEDNLRRRMKFVRNPFGSSHQAASLFAKGRGMQDDGDEDSMTTTTGSEVSEDKISNQNVLTPLGQSSKTVTQSLWKDLLKYQTRVVQHTAEDPMEPEDENTSEPRITDEITPTEQSNETDEREVIDQNQLNILDSNGMEKVLFNEACEIITPSTNSSNRPAYGLLEVTHSKIIFNKSGPGPLTKPFFLTLPSGKYESGEFLWACQTFPQTQWHTHEIRNVLPRTFYLRQIAVEIFFTSRKSVFINFLNKTTALQFIVVVRNTIKPPHIEPFYGYRPQQIIQKMLAPGTAVSLTYAWETREISNFEYLMHLNTIAGRSYHDLGQYPVFPWIIADYLSQELKLREPSTFRDLKWPMGAQRESQRKDLMRKYEDLDYMFQGALKSGEIDFALPPFHYGSHFSTAGFVMWYLMRAEPFTSFHIQLQDGRFDKSDRLFDSIESAYRGCVSNPSDVKELIPEFYSCPEIFENMNNLDLGKKTSTRKQINDIQLPPWAADPFEFIRLNRKALESEYVSRNLHHWIDLIFGYKQRPPHMRSGGNVASVNACNVFFHLTYADAVDLEELLVNDKKLYDQYVHQITEFGQTPAQLFSFPHPQRLPIDAADISWPLASVVLGADTIMKGDMLPDKPKKVLCFKAYQVSMWPVVYIAETSERLVTIDTSRVIGNHMWQALAADVVPPYRLKVDSIALELSHGVESGSSSTSFGLMSPSNSHIREKRISVPFLNPRLISQTTLPSQGVDEEVNADPFPKKEFLKLERDIRRGAIRKPSLRSTQDSLAIAEAALKYGNSPPSKSKAPSSSSSAYTKRRPRTRIIDEHVSSQLFAIHKTLKVLFSCGHWDHSFKATSVESGRLLQSVTAHKDAVTCLAMTSEYGRTWLITGSRDCTLMVWEVQSNREMPIAESPLHILYGHDDAVTSVSVNAELDVVVSGSVDGTVIVHSLREGSYTRSILVGSMPTKNPQTGFNLPASNTPVTSTRRRIHWVCVTKESFVVVYLIDEQLLCTYTVNGRMVAVKDIRERLYSLVPSEDGQVLVTGGENCLVVMRWIYNLEIANDGPRKGLEAVLDGMIEDNEGSRHTFTSPIRSIYFTKHERHLIVGSENGEIRIFAQDSDYLRQRLQVKLEEIGIL